MRSLAHARRVAPLLYFELEGIAANADSRIRGAARAAVARALHAAVGVSLRRDDLVVTGPAGRWFAALLLDRAVSAVARAAVSDADLGVVTGRLRAAIQASIDAAFTSNGHRTAPPVPTSPISVRAGWTIIEPRDAHRPLAELRHALRGAAVVARVEERRALVLAAVTHELRTPLTSIVGFAEQLRDGALKDARKAKRSIAVITDEARRLSRLVDGLIDAGAWQAGRLVLRRRRSDLRAVALKAAKLLGEQARARRVRVVVRGRATADVDPDRLLQMCFNVIDNAVRHARSRVAVNVTRRRDGTDVTVTDDGSGFDPAMGGRLGTPFGVGTNGRVGLGLAIASMLAAAHGGAIVFGARRGGGASVGIKLPRASG